MKHSAKLARILVTAVLAMVLASCAHLHGDGDGGRSHPLNGKLWEVSSQRFIDHGLLAQRMLDARFVLLGEIHDNQMHHEIQTRTLQYLLQNGRRPTLVMEQFDRDQQAKIDAILAGDAPQDDKLRALEQLMRKSWGWKAYEPLLRLALQHRLPVAAANMSREELRPVSRQGFDALAPGEEAWLALDKVWTAERQQRLVQDIVAGHCGKVPQHMADAIARAQRVRDAVMADVMLKYQDSGAVAIIGSGHARRDMGVPLYLAARAPHASFLSLGLVQVNELQEPQRYTLGALGPVFDYAWFTPHARRTVDPCKSIPALPAKPAKATEEA